LWIAGRDRCESIVKAPFQPLREKGRPEKKADNQSGERNQSKWRAAQDTVFRKKELA
jgi:hypothetical protein